MKFLFLFLFVVSAFMFQLVPAPVVGLLGAGLGVVVLFVLFRAFWRA